MKSTTPSGRGAPRGGLALRAFLSGALLIAGTASASRSGAEAGAETSAEKGSFDWEIGGRLQLDGTLASGDAAIEEVFVLRDDSEVRRGRLSIEASFGRHFEAEVEYDFAGGGDPKDVWIGGRDLPVVGTLRLGHQRKPLGLDPLTSSNDVAFLERAITEDSFGEGRDLGLLARNAVLQRRMTWWLGVFQPSDGFDRLDAAAWDANMRLTGLPIWRREGRRLLHLGLSLQHREPPFGSARLRTSPEVHLAPAFVDTGEVAADRVWNTDVELALVRGRFWLSAESFAADLDVRDSANLRFEGFYVQAGWYFTGEHRAYRPEQGIWGRVQPKRPFGSGGGIGAWELALRRSGLDANDGPVRGGELANTTVALNWYPTDFSRVSLDWVHAERVDVGTADFVTLRLQVTW